MRQPHSIEFKLINWHLRERTSFGWRAEIIKKHKPNISAKKCFRTRILMDGSEGKFLIMQKINGAVRMTCHLMNHYHHHRHLHQCINHSSLAQNPHFMAFHCIMVLDVCCSCAHCGKMSVWQVICLTSFLDCIKARYKPSTVTLNRHRSNALAWVTLIIKWLDLGEILSGWIFSDSHPLSPVSVWAWMLSLCRNGRTSLTNEIEDTEASLLIGRTDNAQLTGLHCEE